ncbi:resolvase [Brevibacillus agri]|uniref:Recombinase family protein n=1 Tax=Brevibacillus agri TaxID=51101 RepID=A0A3M8BCZ8_9BACL|nr:MULTISPECIES: recombinase family protein [Brevibacillus]ELK43825.1 resolvase domain-containing protein [Brevibacillus agri BAB-2500]EJL44231.1 site-specific recombinase, DNA invertase Pin [Brevibacillus sp. CF112]MBY0052874.1 recombinase family protein [Brevibacillus agri]MDN4095418.1 recombinase family protein [Brevibacillus agri]MED3501201.1 recombinase family protein [Brevibacillus agri]
MNVIGYVRVSTQGQAKDGYSLAYQQDEILAYCKEQGWNLLHMFCDEGISGAKVDEEALEVDREGFQDMLAALSTHQVDYVVVLNTSRLWRSDIVKVLVHREFKKYGVDVRSIEQPTYSIHKKDPSDFLINGLMELLDQYQRLEIAMKLGRGRNKKAQQGGYAGGRATFGYTVPKGQKALQIDQKQAETVRRLFSLREQYPTWSLSRMALQLNVEGYRTAQGKSFTKVQVKRILDREGFYKGQYTYGHIESQGIHQPII